MKNSDREIFDIRSAVLEAESRIRPYVSETPLERSSWLSDLCGGDVYLKLENFQSTGSFKLRGAANFLLTMDRDKAANGVVTASTGNHAAAFARMTVELGIKGTIYMPENASPAKVEPLRKSGVKIEFFGRDCALTEKHAREKAVEKGQLYLPPYNDPAVISGQGTVAVEIERQLERTGQGAAPYAVFVPVGGGGLASGVAGYFKQGPVDIEMVGCQPANSAVMEESVRAGKIVEVESKPTISDGTAGGIEPGSITFDICRRYIDRFILLEEQEIAGAIRAIIEKHHMLVEGAGALPVAAFLKTSKEYEGKRVVLVLSGSKIGLDSIKLL